MKIWIGASVFALWACTMTLGCMEAFDNENPVAWSVIDTPDEVPSTESPSVEAPTSDEWELCPMNREEDLSRNGACEGHFTKTDPTEEDAQNIYRVLMHELLHVRNRLLGEPGVGLVELAEQVEQGVDHLQGVEDYGSLSGAVSQQTSEDGTSYCAALSFKCWTGGHGGFGPSGLAGDVLVVLHEPTEGSHAKIRAMGFAGLMEWRALDGTPEVELDFEAELSETGGWIPHGTIGGFALPLTSQ